MTDTVPSEIVWGTEVRRRQEGIPFLQYEPRRRSLPSLLEDAHRWAGRDHLVQGERRISFEKFLAAVDAVAGDLRQRGIGPVSVVLLLAANCPEWVVSFWAVSRTGAIIAPGNGWWSEEEVDHVLGLIKPALVIGDPKRLAKITDGGAAATLDVSEIRRPRGRRPAQRQGNGAWRRRRSRGRGRPGGDRLFTSGTTGFPKGATLPHRSVIANLHNLLAVAGRLPQPDRPRACPATSACSPARCSTSAGSENMTMGLVGGTTLVLPRRDGSTPSKGPRPDRTGTGDHVGRRAHHGAAGHRAPVDGGTGPVQPAGPCRWAAPRFHPTSSAAWARRSRTPAAGSRRSTA